MTPILILAGAIAALICFRWARTLLIFGIAAVVLWFFVHHAHAQKSVMVQCRTGASSDVVPDYACDALLDGFAHLSTVEGKENASVMECATVMASHFPNGNRYEYLPYCQHMLVAELTARVNTQMRR